MKQMNLNQIQLSKVSNMFKNGSGLVAGARRAQAKRLDIFVFSQTNFTIFKLELFHDLSFVLYKGLMLFDFWISK